MALAAEEPRVHCAAVFDPYWVSLHPESKALSRFETRTPLLILPSHDWTVPDPATGLVRRAKLPTAARVAALPPLPMRCRPVPSYRP